MKKLAKYIVIGFGLFVFILSALIFRPVPIVAESKAITQTGIVSKIYCNSGNDIVFILENNPQRYYINRGLENGLELNKLKNQLIGNTIIIKYPKYWTPLDWNNSIRHVSKVEFENEVVFNELK